MPRGAQRFADPGRKRPWAASPGLARNQHRRLARPEPAAEQREEKRRVGAHSRHLARESLAVARRASLKCRDVARAIAREQHMRSIRANDARRQVGMGDRKAARLQILADGAP